jgi:hypothetical protein
LLKSVDPDRVRNRAEIGPAQDLIHLAKDGGVILPLSSAHVRETAPLDGDRRYAVGIAMAGLSSGWQMRHPNHVWRSEITRMLATELEIEAPSDVDLPVFTLEPHAILDDDVHAFEMDPDDVNLFMLAHTSPSLILELLLHPERQPAVPIATWVERNQSITNGLAESALSTSEKRCAAFAYGWKDKLRPRTSRAGTPRTRSQCHQTPHHKRDSATPV